MTRVIVLRTKQRTDDTPPGEPLYELLGQVDASGAATAVRAAREALGVADEGGEFHVIPVFNWTTLDAEPYTPQPKTKLTKRDAPGVLLEAPQQTLDVESPPVAVSDALAASWQDGGGLGNNGESQ